MSLPSQDEWPAIPYPVWKNDDDIDMVDVSQIDPAILIASFPEDRRDRVFNATLRARLKAVIDDLEATVQPSSESSADDGDVAKNESLSATISHLKHLHNACNFVSSLPPEVLIIIIGYYSSLCAEEENLWAAIFEPFENGEARGRPYAWIRITHVCQHWRCVALNTSSLWRVVFVTSNQDCLSEMMRRAKGFPEYLSVAVRGGDAHVSQALQTLDGSAQTLQTLEVQVSSNEALNILGNTFVPGSQLVGLIVLHDDFHSSTFVHSPNDSVSGPPFLHPDMRLQELYYMLPCIEWSNGLAIATLRSLKLYSKCSSTTCSQLSIHVALSKLHALEELHLFDILPVVDDPDYVPTVNASNSRYLLPKLKTLRIGSVRPPAPSVCMRFLQSFSFSRQVCVDFITLFGPHTASIIPSCTRALMEHYPHSGDRCGPNDVLHKLFLTRLPQSTEPTSDILEVTLLIVEGKSEEGASFSLTYYLTGQDCEASNSCWFRQALIATLDGLGEGLGRCRVLGLDFRDSQFPISFWSTIAEKTSCIQKFIASGSCDYLPTLLSHSDISPAKHGVSPEESFSNFQPTIRRQNVCPTYWSHLSSLHFDNVDFGSTIDGTEETLYDRLQESLVIRHELGYGLKGVSVWEGKGLPEYDEDRLVEG